MYENEIGHIQSLIKNIDGISLNYLEIIDPIRNRADVIIKRIFGDSSDYYKHFNEIIFPEFPKPFHSIQYSSIQYSSIQYSFIAIELEKAKTELIYLLNTMIKDLELKEKFYPLDINEKEWLPEDILSKGKEMSQYYILVYFIENSLRIFIDKICTDKYGENFIKKINISGDLSKKIGDRKSEDKKHKWLSVRGGNDLFYLDLEDLKNIIQNNWNDFSNNFPNQNWITAKIEEISKIRNLIAHNSYMEKNDSDLLRHYYIQILKQIHT